MTLQGQRRRLNSERSKNQCPSQPLQPLQAKLTFDRLTDITNELQALGTTEITQHEVVKTLLRSLDSSFDILALMMQERPDFKTLDPSDILERLNTHEFQLSEDRKSVV